MVDNDWMSIKIPAKLAEAVDRVFPRTTFTNRNRFCEDAIRSEVRRILQEELNNGGVPDAPDFDEEDH